MFVYCPKRCAKRAYNSIYCPQFIQIWFSLLRISHELNVSALHLTCVFFLICWENGSIFSSENKLDSAGRREFYHGSIRQHLTDWSHWLKVMNDQVLVMVRVNLTVWNVSASFPCLEPFYLPREGASGFVENVQIFVLLLFFTLADFEQAWTYWENMRGAMRENHMWVDSRWRESFVTTGHRGCRRIYFKFRKTSVCVWIWLSHCKIYLEYDILSLQANAVHQKQTMLFIFDFLTNK